MKDKAYLSKREQQIMEFAYEREGFTAAELCEHLPGNPANSTVRTLLRILEEKAQLNHVEQDGKFIYSPLQPRQRAAKSALRGVLDTFFKGSISDVVAALISESDQRLGHEEIEKLQQMIDRAKEEKG